MRFLGGIYLLFVLSLLSQVQSGGLQTYSQYQT